MKPSVSTPAMRRSMPKPKQQRLIAAVRQIDLRG